jgi:anti-anti-sigma factor
MPTTGSRLLVAVAGACAIVRVSGRASFTCSGDFKALVYDLLERGTGQFVLDLSDCVIMDSTFLGILARFAQKLSEPGGAPDRLVLRNANARIVDLLDNLGVSQLFTLIQGDGPVQVACEPVPMTETDKVEATRIALEAHRTLMELNPANVPKFKDVAQFMAEDLRKLEQNGKNAPRSKPGR